MAVGSPSFSTHSLTTLDPSHQQHTRTNRPAPLDTSKFTTESPRPTPRDLYSLFPPNQGLPDDDVLLTIRPAWKRRLHELLEQPASSSPAFAVHMASTALIVLSAVISARDGADVSSVFTVEYARVVCWSFSWSSLFGWVLCASLHLYRSSVMLMLWVAFYGIIDLLSVLPYSIELMLGQDTSVLSPSCACSAFSASSARSATTTPSSLMSLSVRRSQHALLAIGFFVVMILTVFSTLLYFAERGTWDEVMDAFINSDGDPTQFASIPAAAWFVIHILSPSPACPTPRSPSILTVHPCRSTVDPQLNNIPILHNPPPPASVVQVALNRTRRRRHRHYPASTSHWMKRYSSDPLVLRSNPPTHTARNLAFVYSSL
ncbi:hypothetical protein D9611_014626 [Ephemerocybe angulata]|uniref:Transmembrane protein n=1 Tax=Ephemerocybe angulata TaxID=980116 RepID=A0A8H5FIC2_9AGAR|nr:hypothetical protein D9611_014626 [Tulosesus angulatus]